MTCKACAGPVGRSGDKDRGLCSRCAFENPAPLPLSGLPLPPSQFTAAGFEARPSRGKGRNPL